MQEVIKKISTLGIIGVIFVITMAATGLSGAAITIALATISGSAGMMGGIAVIGITGLIAVALAKFSMGIVNQITTQQLKVANSISKLTEEVIKDLENVPGMTFAEERDFKKSRPIFILRDKTVVRTWKNPLGVEHIFLADNNGKIIYGGFVGWIHSDGLKKAININKIRKNYT